MRPSALATRAQRAPWIVLLCAIASIGLATRLAAAASPSPIGETFRKVLAPRVAAGRPGRPPGWWQAARAAAARAGQPPTLVATRGWARVLPAHGQPLWLAAPSRPDDASGSPGAPAASPTPVVTMLHGMCSDPRATCERVRTAATRVGWLACPTGNATCGQAADWVGSGEQKASFLDQSLAELDRLRAEQANEQTGDVLIGFSRGAFVARDVAYARAGRWVGLILIGAAMVPDAERLQRSGIRRVLLAAGDFDGARPTMQRAAAVLTRRGLPARFVGLGPIYHALPADLDQRLEAWLEWVRATAPTT